jgi:hypothetical protein
MLHIPRVNESSPATDQKRDRCVLFLRIQSRQVLDASSIRQGVVPGFSRPHVAMPAERVTARKREAELCDCIF